MAALKEAFSTLVTFTKTNANLATSATAGWQSQTIDNTTDLMLDFLFEIELAAVNTAPANSKSILLYVAALVDPSGSAFTSTGDGTPSGSEGTITFPDVTANGIVCKLLDAILYSVQNKAINGGPYSVARIFGGVLPEKFVFLMINHSGMTLSVTAIKGKPIYRTVA